MLINWLYLLVTMLLSAIIIAIVIPVLVVSARKNKLYDKPSLRKVHTHNIPRIGGLCFAPTMLIVVSLVMGISLYFTHEQTIFYRGVGVRILLLISGLMSIYLIGFIDDILGVPYRRKFIVQIIAAGLIAFPGNVIRDFQGILFLNEIPYFIAFPFTCIVVILLINTYNLSDGIDGLCAGLGIIFLLARGVVGISGDITIEGLIAVSLLGILAAFFYFNVFGKRFKIFMGDTGSYSIGYIIAYLFLSIIREQPQISNISHSSNILIGVSMVFVPVFDTIRVFFERIKNGHSPFLPDENHLHHKLLRRGHKHLHVTIFIISLQIFILIMNYILSEFILLNINIILLIDCVICLSFVLYLDWKNKKEGKEGPIVSLTTDDKKQA